MNARGRGGGGLVLLYGSFCACNLCNRFASYYFPKSYANLKTQPRFGFLRNGTVIRRIRWRDAQLCNSGFTPRFWLRAVSHCAESIFSNFEFVYLCENNFLSKTISSCLSGAQMGSIHGKKIAVENLVTLSLWEIKSGTIRLTSALTWTKKL